MQLCFAPSFLMSRQSSRVMGNCLIIQNKKAMGLVKADPPQIEEPPAVAASAGVVRIKVVIRKRELEEMMRSGVSLGVLAPKLWRKRRGSLEWSASLDSIPEGIDP
ncbi:hypothetical protein HPP92_007818 [Vanilla planifolia]|uniref:Uncharacterized protein n=1 Tax=Vanilla planifolia TaxID=51239 RepID=A0A835V857_VANPL|nr:hypothetical protein HPP92_007818 [Vanilla planifolia]